MDKFKYYFVKFTRNYLFKIIISLFLGVGLMLLLRFYAFNLKNELMAWCDSLFICFGFLFGIGALSLLNYLGAFDLLAYSFANIISVIVHKDNKKYVDAIDYRDKRIERSRKVKFSFLVYMGISLLFLIAAITIYIIIKFKYNV